MIRPHLTEWKAVTVLFLFGLAYGWGIEPTPAAKTEASESKSHASNETSSQDIGLDGLDTNKDGAISESEFLDYHLERYRQLFAMLDGNDDGEIRGEELEKLPMGRAGSQAATSTTGLNRLERPRSASASEIKIAGGLLFGEMRKEAAPEAGQTSVKMKFEFSNPQGRPVEILGIKTSCGCLKAVSDRQVYQPGQAGWIEAEFTAKGSGNLSKSITVTTNWEQDPSATLTANLVLPTLAKLDPKMTVWTSDEALKPKIVTYKVLEGEAPIHLTSVSSSNAAVSATLKPIKDGQHYEIEISPPSNPDQRIIGVIRIQTDRAGTESAFYRIEAKAE